MISAFFTSPYLYVVLFGFLLGSAELMGRYRYDPLRVFSCPYAWFYVGINGAISAVSLFLIDTLGLEFTATGTEPGTTAGPDASTVYNVIMAGFGGGAFFRSSVMKVKTSDAEIAIGPAFFLDTILQITDRGVDRSLAKHRAREITRMMDGINVGQTQSLVVPFCLSLMQNLTAAEREALLKETSRLALEVSDENLGGKTNSLQLGLKIVELVGFSVLDAAIKVLKEKGLIPKDNAEQEKRKQKLLQAIRKISPA